MNDKAYEAYMAGHLEKMVNGKGNDYVHFYYLVKFKGRYLFTIEQSMGNPDTSSTIKDKLFNYIIDRLYYYNYGVYSTFKYAESYKSMELIDILIANGSLTLEYVE